MLNYYQTSMMWEAHRDTLRRTCVFPPGGIYGSRSAFLCIWGTRRRHTVFMLGWAQCNFHKKRVGTSYAEFVFFHLVRSTGRVAYSCASGTRNVDELCFILVWDQCSFHKKCVMTHYAKLVFLHSVRPRRETMTHYFSVLGGPGAVSIKAHQDTVCRTFVFEHSGIYGSRSAFRCVRVAKCRRTIFLARVGPVWIPQKALRDTVHRTCVFPSGGICGSCNAFWCVRGLKHRRNTFHAQVGPVRFP
jgi:hypothetical protein